jgi:hypothetical protein
MKNMVTLIKRFCMWIALVVIGVSLMELVLTKLVWFLGVTLLDPVKALGYLIIGSIIFIGLYQFVEEVKK